MITSRIDAAFAIHFEINQLWHFLRTFTLNYFKNHMKVNILYYFISIISKCTLFSKNIYHLSLQKKFLTMSPSSGCLSPQKRFEVEFPGITLQKTLKILLCTLPYI